MTSEEEERPLLSKQQKNILAAIDAPSARPRASIHDRTVLRYHRHEEKSYLYPEHCSFEVYIVLQRCSRIIDLNVVYKYEIPEDIVRKARSYREREKEHRSRKQPKSEIFWNKELREYVFDSLRDLSEACCFCSTKYLEEVLRSLHQHDISKCEQHPNGVQLPVPVDQAPAPSPNTCQDDRSPGQSPSPPDLTTPQPHAGVSDVGQQQATEQVVKIKGARKPLPGATPRTHSGVEIDRVKDSSF